MAIIFGRETIEVVAASKVSTYWIRALDSDTRWEVSNKQNLKKKIIFATLPHQCSGKNSESK